MTLTFRAEICHVMCTESGDYKNLQFSINVTVGMMLAAEGDTSRNTVAIHRRLARSYVALRAAATD